jgi:hypothetical protein
MQFEELRREIGVANHYKVSSIAGWCVNVLGSLNRAGGRGQLFEDFSYLKQRAIIAHYASLQRRWTGTDARRAARLMQLYLTAAAEGDEELAETIYAFIVSHAETMLRRWRRRCRMN